MCLNAEQKQCKEEKNRSISTVQVVPVPTRYRASEEFLHEQLPASLLPFRVGNRCKVGVTSDGRLTHHPEVGKPAIAAALIRIDEPVQ